MGCLSGGSLGTLAGAAIGSVVPGVGTALGAGLGGALGGALGGSSSTNSAGGPSGGGGFIQSAFGSAPTIYSKNPSWVNNAAQANYGNAQTAATQPYQPYTGQQVAPLTANQTQASTVASNAPGQFNNTYGAITNYYNQSAQPNTATYTPTAVGYNNVNSTNNQQSISAPATWTAQQAQQYMSPYLQSSLNPQIQNLNLQYGLQQNQANAAAAGAGDFGGSRQGVANALINRQQNQDIQNVESTGYNTAYNTGLGAFQTANNQNLNAQTEQANIYGQNNAANLQAQLANQNAGINTGEYNNTAAQNAFTENQNIAQQNRLAEQAAAAGLTGLTSTQQANQNNILSNLMNTGGAAQTTNQASDTANYQDYLNKLYYPEQQSSYLQGILGNSNSGSLSAGQPGVLGNNGVGNLTNSLTNGPLGASLGKLGTSVGNYFNGSSAPGAQNYAGPWVNPDTGVATPWQNPDMTTPYIG